MRFFEIVVSGAALVSAALALTIDTYPTAGVQAGQTYTITYSPKDQTPTTFVLRRGASGNLDTVGPIGTATGGSFTWTVPRDLPNADTYALEVRQGTTNNYSGQFKLEGGSGSLSSAIASAASSVRASASSVIASLSSQASSIAASATISPSVGTNGTVSSATLSRTGSATSGTSRPTASGTSTGVPQSTGAASSLDSSPMALIFGAIAAIAYVH